MRRFIYFILDHVVPNIIFFNVLHFILVGQGEKVWWLFILYFIYIYTKEIKQKFMFSDICKIELVYSKMFKLPSNLHVIYR